MINKKTTTGLTLFAALLCLMITGCNKGSYSGGKPDLSSNIDSVSYGFGYLNGKQMSQSGMDDINPQQFVAGMEQAFNGDSSAIPEDSIRSILRQYQMKAQQKAQAKQMQQGKKNEKAGEAFLAKNKKKPGVKTTQSSLQYKVLQPGSGKSPTKKDTVVVQYKGMHLNGKVFDSSYKRGQPATFPLTGIIPGLSEGIQLMKPGAKYKFWIPAKLAYGTHTRPGGPIGPNETLVFEIKLLKIKK